MGMRLIDPELWETHEIESLFELGYNIQGNFVVKQTPLLTERIACGVEGNWMYCSEVAGLEPNKIEFPNFLKLLNFLNQ